MADDGRWAGDRDPLSDDRERRHVFSVLDSFRSYRRSAHFNITHVRRQNFYALPQSHQEYLRSSPISYLDTLSSVDDAIDINADLAEQIMYSGAAALGIDVREDADLGWEGCATQQDLDKCRSTINQFYRDWAEDGRVERDLCYGPVLADLKRLLPVPTPNQEANGDTLRPKVLIPGAGLGRLVYELCCAGYVAEGNELSYHQLFASSFILNSPLKPNSVALYPFIHSFSNNLTRQSQLRKVLIPDVSMSLQALLEEGANPGSMSMTTGDFQVLYSQPDFASTFDAVATVFFIDTAPNLLRYVETVQSCLRVGGLWFNLGPLLWHFHSRNGANDKDGDGAATDDADLGIAAPGSFELSHDEIVHLLNDHGFEILKDEESVGPIGYIQNPSSMFQNIYKPVYWIARKR